MDINLLVELPASAAHHVLGGNVIPINDNVVHTASRSLKAKTDQRRRTRGSTYQREYRAKQKTINTQRVDTIAALQLEIARLEGRIELLHTVVPASIRTFQPETSIMAEYFRLYEQGYTSKTAACVRATQQAFLTSTMREDMVFMDDVGVEKLIAQWNVYTTVFDSFNMEIRSIRVVAFSPDVVVHADAMLHLRISRLTIETLFRHLLGDEPLTQRLIGQSLELPLQICFAFDSDTKVVRYDTHVNIVLGLSNLLGSFEDTVTALKHFQMRENAEIVVEENMMQL
ncbi:Aste57867_1429 [Aphanomyces stellatus]|uniref:Aste57867_1429 protein n=1 Tax=Aphanomyces stellatus TaxID=120398 RepID=A0A485K6F6_9STRA|nr:hypothetical protein As57867_001428 [Aphanomyces stellatus]VFT78646.1 Aste57867_1429 [Aphanomyces stellatus]